MTKEEAKKEWIARAYPLNGYRFDEIIDDIYNYFESRTCENCIYHTESNLVCDARIGRPSEHEIHFGCNKFERE